MVLFICVPGVCVVGLVYLCARGGSCLFVYGGLQPAVLVESSAALMGRLDTELALKIHSGIATDIYRNCGPMLKSCFL